MTTTTLDRDPVAVNLSADGDVALLTVEHEGYKTEARWGLRTAFAEGGRRSLFLEGLLSDADWSALARLAARAVLDDAPACEELLQLAPMSVSWAWSDGDGSLLPGLEVRWATGCGWWNPLQGWTSDDGDGAALDLTEAETERLTDQARRVWGELKEGRAA